MTLNDIHLKYIPIAIRTLVLISGALTLPARAQQVATPRGAFPAARYQGVSEDGVDVYRGIRYAAAPTGELRWAAPVPPQSSDSESVVDASHFGSACPQLASPFGVASTNEDCLFLNVYVPQTSRTRGRLPVMVFLYGGAFVSGASDLYDAKQLAKSSDVIVVSVNYRLGALGFMASPELSQSQPRRISGNYGLLDQELALRWVQQNVAAFGGDARNVTLFGESAGAFSICAQLVRPTTAGLYARVILESGPCAFPLPALSNAENVGSAITTKAGCARGTAEQTLTCLRGLSVQQVLDAQPTSAELFTSSTGLTAFFPTVEGVIIPQQPQDALGSGQFVRVPVMGGTNADEGRLFVALTFDLQRDSPLSSAEYPERVRATAQTLVTQLSGMGSPLTERVLTQQILQEYPLSSYTSAGEALSAVMGDSTFSCPAQFAHQLFSLNTPTYAYEFADRSVKLGFLPAASFPYGATHTAELQFLFSLPGSGALTPDEQKLAATMKGYWSQFAQTAVPSLGVPQQPVWPLYTLAAPVVQSLVAPTPTTTLDFAARHHCNFWQGILLQASALSALGASR